MSKDIQILYAIFCLIFLFLLGGLILMICSTVTAPSPEERCEKQYGRGAAYNVVSHVCVLPNGDLKGIK